MTEVVTPVIPLELRRRQHQARRIDSERAHGNPSHPRELHALHSGGAEVGMLSDGAVRIGNTGALYRPRAICMPLKSVSTCSRIVESLTARPITPSSAVWSCAMCSISACIASRLPIILSKTT